MSSVVPEGWSNSPLQDICFFQEGPGLRNWQYRDRGTKFINIRCIQGGDINTSVAQHLSDEEVKEKYSHFLLNEGDYVLSSSGTIGRLALVKKHHLPMLLNTSVIRFRSIDETRLDSLFLRHFLQSKQFFDKISEQSQGSAQVNFGPTHLKVLDALLPPLPEQKKIASILTSVDEVIENTQKQIDKLQDLKKATMNELLTKGIGHTEFKDSKLGLIPKSWEVKTIAELLELKNGLNTNSDAFGSGSPFVSYKDIYKDAELTERSLSQKVTVSEREKESFSVSYGDIFFTRTSETPEEIGFANVYLGHNVGAVFNGFCIRGRPITNKISARLSRYLFRSDYLRVQMRFLCKYTTRAGISGESLNRCLLALPPIDEQEKYIKTLHSIENMIEAAGEKLTQTKSLKKSLMQDLLTGKVQVTVN